MTRIESEKFLLWRSKVYDIYSLHFLAPTVYTFWHLSTSSTVSKVILTMLVWFRSWQSFCFRVSDIWRLAFIMNSDNYDLIRFSSFKVFEIFVTIWYGRILSFYQRRFVYISVCLVIRISRCWGREAPPGGCEAPITVGKLLHISF